MKKEDLSIVLGFNMECVWLHILFMHKSRLLNNFFFRILGSAKHTQKSYDRILDSASTIFNFTRFGAMVVLSNEKK